MSRFSWRTWRGVLGAAVLGVVLVRTGSGPFVTGVRALDAGTLALGAGLAVPIALACSWRWRLVAEGLGVGVRLGPAMASSYRAQFLNVTLPGGVLGDVDRGVRHGREAGDTGRGLRAVAWERFAGQVVQLVIAAAVLLLLPSPVRSRAPAALGLVLLGLTAVLAARPLLRTVGDGSLIRRISRAVREDVSRGLLSRRAWPGVVLASAVAVGGHLSTYLLAARAVDVSASTVTLVPLALLVLLAAGLPTNLAGWGPREGMAAWAFGAAGLGAEQGVATAVAYGAIVLVASLPGAVVLLVAALRRAAGRPVEPSLQTPVRVVGQGWCAHG